MDKITQAIAMVKQAVKHGFQAHFVLTPSGFRNKGFIQVIRKLRVLTS